MFDKLVGNHHIKTTLRRLLGRGRVPNAMLFAGDDGIGKRQFALELARNFLCTDDEVDEACGLCPACRRADVFAFPKADAKGEDYDEVFFSEHPDVGTVIPFNRNLRVGAIRELEREANFRPYEGSARFFIVDDADKMNESASNALLKTLEEPPPTTYIFLITSRPDSLLPTIRSRCQVLRFAPVGKDEIEQYLINERAFSHDEARLASRLSRGSIGRAVSLDIADFRSCRERMLSTLHSAIATGDRASLMRVSEEMSDAKNKENFEESLGILDSLIHDIWSLRTAGDETRLANADLTDYLRRLADQAGPADLPGWLADIETMRQNLIVNINRKVAIAALFAGMAS